MLIGTYKNFIGFVYEHFVDKNYWFFMRWWGCDYDYRNEDYHYEWGFRIFGFVIHLGCVRPKGNHVGLKSKVGLKKSYKIYKCLKGE